MIKRHGKSLDVTRLKQPVLADVHAHIAAVSAMTSYLAEHEEAIPQEACYVCQSERAHASATVHGFTYLECDNCSHFYTSRRYPAEAISRFYQQNEYYARVTYANKETCFYRREDVARPKVRFVEERSGDGRGLWIDVGSGIGDVVSVAAEHGWDAVGLEISETSVAFARQVFGVELVPETLEAYMRSRPEIAGRARVLSFLGVLEHGVDPLAELRRAHQLLGTGGLVLIQVPNGRSMSSLIQTVFPEHVFRHMSPASHIMLFTERSLLTALARTGYEPLAMWYLGLDVYELLNTLTALNDRVAGSGLQRLLTERFNELQAVLDAHEMSDGLICVARKV